MFVASLKLLAAGAAMLGPFMAGAALSVTVPEVTPFFVIAGCGLGLAGLFGFACLDTRDDRRHRERMAYGRAVNRRLEG